MDTFGQLVFMIILGGYSTLMRGMAITVLWGWFAVPTFGLKPISFVMAVGISILSNMFHHFKITEEDLATPFVRMALKAFVMATLVPLFGLMSGWIIHLFI